MPNRIIKESIKRSPEIDRLSWFEEVVFYRLIVTADDYGRLDGRPVVLKNDLFPTKETVTKKAIEDAISKLVSVGLLIPYVDAESDMPYLAFKKWEKHQTIRNKYSRYPAPPNDLIADCKHLQTDCKQTLEKCCDESESNPNPNKNQNPTPPLPPTGEMSTAAAYAMEILPRLTPKQMEELNSFRADLPDELICHALDIAAEHTRSWAYVKGILNRYMDEGVRTLGDAMAQEAKRKQEKRNGVGPANAKEPNPALNYQQREYHDEDFGDDFFEDLTKYAEEA